MSLVGKIVLWEIFLHAYVLKGELKASTMKSGIEYMTFLADWYTDNSKNGIGFFQIVTGIVLI